METVAAIVVAIAIVALVFLGIALLMGAIALIASFFWTQAASWRGVRSSTA